MLSDRCAGPEGTGSRKEYDLEMARPRKQTYTLDMYLKKNKKGDIDNNADVQRNFAWNNEQINELIVTVLTDDYIPPIILGEEADSKLRIVDGGCRTAALRKFREGNYKITSSIENSLIPYKKKVVGRNGKTVYEDGLFDIKNKTYAKLPEELKEKFDEYQIETVIHECCDSGRISGYIKRYNNHVAMNTDQRAFTYIDRYAGRIRQISESRFFLECSNYSERDKTKGGIERIIVETLMCMNHFENWKKQPKALCQYLNDNAKEEEFALLTQHLRRLEKVITADIKDIFNKKDSFLFLTLFDKFSGLGMEDIRFAEFLRTFQKNLRAVRRNRKGLLFDEIGRGLSTKDRPVIADKLEMLEGLMLEYLHIGGSDKAAGLKAQQARTVTPKEILAEYEDEEVTDEDIELYEIIANDISEAIEDIDSGLLSDENRPSFVALVGYAVREDTEGLLKKWLPGFEKKRPPIRSQKQNYLYMKKAFEQFAAQ